MFNSARKLKFKHVFKSFSVLVLLSYSEISFSDDPMIQKGDRWSSTILEFSVPAPKGHDGRDGVSYDGERASSGGSGFAGMSGGDGTKGRDGGHATDPDKGMNGGEADLFFDIPTQASPGLITVTGYLAPLQGVRRQLEKFKVILENKGFIRPVARGGQGGHGGYGGYGEAGGHGGRGGDGIGRQSGGDGGNGGRGGDAGSATSGANAGRGGKVRIGIPANSLQVAWVVDPHVPGGVGGTHGEHGKPGGGGSGGSGGRGGTYTETVTRTRTVRDKDGNTSSETYTETVTRQAPNGSSGSNGASGSSSSKTLSDGSNGEVGIVEWYVVDGSGKVISTESNRFQLNLVGFRFKDLNSGHIADGIFEPGEKGLIEQIFVKNNGLIPTPANAKTRIKIRSGAYFITDEIEMPLPEGLAPGEVRLVTDSSGKELQIPFEVKNLGFKTPGVEPFIRQEMIKPIGLADVAQIERVIPEFNEVNGGLKEFTVQFPVMIEPINTIPSLARGEASKFIFKITNISGQDFGSESEIKRQLEFYIKRQGGDLKAEDIEFYDLEGKSISLNEGFLKEITNLRANQSRIIEFVVGVSGAADSYRSSISRVDLSIDRLGTQNRQGLQTVQRRLHVLNIADDYFHTPDADILLVTNHRMSRDAYEAWKTVAERLETSVDIWDLSYKNFISFMEKLTSGNEVEQKNDGYSEHRTSLAQDFAGKTIILLANMFEDTSGEHNGKAQNVWDYVKLQDLRKAAIKHNINLRIIGPNDEKRTFLDLISPHAIEEKRVDYSNMKELYEAVKTTDVLTADQINDADYWEVGLKAPVTRWRYFTVSTQRFIEKQAAKLLGYAQKQDPDADYVVVHRFSGDVQKRHGVLWNIAWFGKTYNEGDLEILRSVKKDAGHLVATQKEEWVFNSKDYILSHENLVELFLSRNFERNFKQFESYISRYSRLTEDQKKVIPALSEAMMKMLVLEQVSLRTRLGYMSRSRSALSQRLEYLEFLMSHKFEISKTTPVEVQKLIMDMILNLQIYSEGQRTWWEKYLLLNMTKNARITKYTQQMARNLMFKWFGKSFSKKEIKVMLASSLERKRFMLNGRYHLAKKNGSPVSRAQLAIDRVSVESLIKGDVRFTGLVARDDFNSTQARLTQRDASVITSSATSRDRRGNMRAANPMIEDRLDRIVRNSGNSNTQSRVCEVFLSQ